jgi:outer membrane protein
VAGELASALGLRADVSLVLAPPPDLAGFSLGEQAVERLIETAKTVRPDLLAAQARVRQSEADLRVAEADGKPQLSLFGTAGGSASSPGADPLNGAIGVRLQVPIFTGYRDTYRIRAAREQIDARRAELDRVGNDVSLEVWQSWQQLRTEGQSYRAALDLTASAREAYDAALARYRAGVGTLIDLLNAQGAVADADFQRIRAQYNWYAAKASLVRSLGTIEPRLFAQTP